MPWRLASLSNKSMHLLGQCRRITERHECPSVFASISSAYQYGRRDHGLARSHGVRERAGDDLRRVEIGRDVNIRRADELDELLQADKSVVKDYVTFDALFLSQPLQRQPVGFAVVPLDVGMGRADDEVHDVGMLGQNGRQGGDDILDTLVR